MRVLRLLLFPFSILYGYITGFRNFLYDKGLLESSQFDIPIITVGNLSVGGTGKSPMIEYLISFLQKEYRIAVLSRGYGRSTKGYKEVSIENKAIEVGDEPLQIKRKFPDILVAVCANRRFGIKNLQERVDVILLDDAFQHRKVAASTTILLTPFHDLFIDDFMLPTGNLREPRIGSNRANCIVVTKCPEKVAYATLQQIEFRLPLGEMQKLYFSKIAYSEILINKTEEISMSYLTGKHFTLVTGIADPTPLVSYLNGRGLNFKHLQYPDHHIFTDTEIQDIAKEDLIVTTEKDYMRLHTRLDKFALYYLPIRTEILKDQAIFFEEFVIKSIDKKRLG